MAIEEHLNELGYQYSYHWMDKENQLIIRWDNAPHHLDIALHHKHTGTKENISMSQEMNLRKVLDYIAKIIGFFIGLSFIFWIFC